MANRDTKLNIIVDAQNRTQGTFNNLKNNLDAVKRSHEGLISAMRGVGIAGTVALGGLSLLTKAIIQAGAGFEQTQIAFETMIGDAELARRTLRDLSQFAARTPFELTQLEEASKRLLAYGIEVNDLIPTLRMLGDISAGVGMDKLPQLILAFGQVRAATRLTGMELRQFSEAGVPLLGTLAEQLGKTEREIIEMVSAGEIGFPLVQEALASLTGEGGKFFNLMEKQSTTLGGLWSNLQDEISLTARAIGEELLPYLKPLLENLIALTQRVGEFVKAHPKFSAAVLGLSLAFAALLALLFPLAIMLPGLILMWGGLSAAVAAFTLISAPVLLVIAGIITMLVLLAKNGYFTLEAWQDVWLGMKVIAAETANSVIGFVDKMVTHIVDAINVVIRSVNKVIRAMKKVPGIGRGIRTISELEAPEFQRLDTNTIATNDLLARGNGGTQRNLYIDLKGSTLLSDDVAEQIGDQIMKRLKLSNAL